MEITDEAWGFTIYSLIGFFLRELVSEEQRRVLFANCRLVRSWCQNRKDTEIRRDKTFFQSLFRQPFDGISPSAEKTLHLAEYSRTKSAHLC
jgi:hypothetical protein